MLGLGPPFGICLPFHKHRPEFFLERPLCSRLRGCALKHSPSCDLNQDLPGSLFSKGLVSLWVRKHRPISTWSQLLFK